mgnify:CR=1 FL=1
MMLHPVGQPLIIVAGSRLDQILRIDRLRIHRIIQRIRDQLCAQILITVQHVLQQLKMPHLIFQESWIQIFDALLRGLDRFIIIRQRIFIFRI